MISIPPEVHDVTLIKDDWIRALDDEDLAFIKQFVLASGSLKKLATHYAISYPTVRLRLDRLIAKIEVAEAFSRTKPFERTLRVCFADGKIDGRTFKKLLKAYFQEQEDPNG